MYRPTTEMSTITDIIISIIIIILPWYFIPRVLKLANIKMYAEWLRWGLGNCERVGKAHCVETLNCH